MNWALIVPLIGSFLSGVKGQCMVMHLEKIIQNNVQIIGDFEVKIMELQLKLDESVYKDELIESLKKKIELLTKNYRNNCPESCKILEEKNKDLLAKNPGNNCSESGKISEEKNKDSLSKNNGNNCSESGKILEEKNKGLRVEIDSCRQSKLSIERNLQECQLQVRELRDATTTTTQSTTVRNKIEIIPEEQSTTELPKKHTTTQSTTIPKKPTKLSPILDTNSSSSEEEDAIETQENRPALRDCAFNGFASGIRQITLPGIKPITVLCDGNTIGPGWTVIQRRFNGSIDFYRSWKDYKHGFGSLKGEFFIGLEKLYHMTNGERYQLYIQLDKPDGDDFIYARYDDFQVGSESTNYVLKKVGRKTGTAGNRLQNHVGQMFTTYDRDNDDCDNINCANKYHSGWWHTRKTIATSNLNGNYYQKNTNALDGIHWETSYSHKSVIMLIRPLLKQRANY